MTTTTPYMSLVLPDLGASPGVWDNLGNAAWTILDGHTHAAGSGVLIRPNAIGINADLTFAGFSLTNLRAAVFTAQSAFATALSLYVKGNDLYYRDGASNEIRFSASGAINIATTGGITGDYISANAAVYYDAAAKTYRFLSAAPLPNIWQYVATGGVDLYEQGSGILTRVRLSSPGTLAASYEVVYPAALPADTALMQITSAGVMTFTNTIAEAVAMVKSLTVGTTLGVTGLITATAGLTAAANQHVTVSGTGDFKHGSQVLNVSPYAGADAGTTTVGVGYVVSNAIGIRYIPIPLKAGDRVTDAQYSIYGDGAVDVTIEIVQYTGANVRTVLGTVTKNNEAAAWTTYSLAVTDTTLSSNDQLVLEWTYSATNARLGGCSVTFTRP